MKDFVHYLEQAKKNKDSNQSNSARPAEISQLNSQKEKLNDENNELSLKQFNLSIEDRIFFHEKMRQPNDVKLTQEELDRLTTILLKCRYVIADLGNSCWTHKHFSEEIQTRQYRSPEVILCAHYDTTADLWSLACMLFELLTGDFLFDPQEGQGFTRDEDHLAQIIELIGKPPLSELKMGKNFQKYFTSYGELKNIKEFNFWSLDRVLTEKYKKDEQTASDFAHFLLPMLMFHPKCRASAADCLRHSWMMFGLKDALEKKNENNITDRTQRYVVNVDDEILV